MAHESLVLAIDAGTHAIKCAVINAQGEILNLLQTPLDLHKASNSRVEQKPEDIIRALKQSLSPLLQEYGERISKVGLAVQRSSVIAVDAQTGQAFSPILSWQDTRGAEQVAQLESFAGDIQRRTGLRLSAHFGASKLHWLNVNCGDQRPLAVLPLASYILSLLVYGHDFSKPPSTAAKFFCDESIASRMQLWNIHERCWDQHLLKLFKLEDAILPSVKPSLADYGRIHSSWYEDELAPNQRVKIGLCLGDQGAAVVGALGLKEKGLKEKGLAENTCKVQSANLGHNQNQSKIKAQPILVNFGTGAFVLRQLNQPDISNQTSVLSVLYSDKLNLCRAHEASINGCGAALTWLKHHLQQDYAWQLDDQEFLSKVQSVLAEKVQFKDLDFVFINSIGGLAAPWWCPSLKAQFIPAQQSPEQKIIAVVESIIFLVFSNVQLFQNQSPCSVYISGGVSQLDSVGQGLANLLQQPVQRCGQSQTTLLGLAQLLRGQAMEHKQKIDKCYEPQNDVALNRRWQFFKQSLEARLSDHKLKIKLS